LRLRSTIVLIPQIGRLLFELGWIMMTLNWRVGRAKRSFERELIRQGFSSEDAKRLSRHITRMKDELVDSIWKHAWS
jgi:hypothetical protein